MKKVSKVGLAMGRRVALGTLSHPPTEVIKLQAIERLLKAEKPQGPLELPIKAPDKALEFVNRAIANQLGLTTNEHRKQICAAYRTGPRFPNPHRI